MINNNPEQYTFEYLMERALRRVPDTMDKRQGSIIYNAIAPAILEIALFYNELAALELDTSVDTASGDRLTLRCAEKGVFRKTATPAQRMGTFNMVVPLGSRFSIEGINYYVKQHIDETTYMLECEQGGEIGNEYFGNLLPITFITGLTSAVITDVIVPGADEETDDSLRNRYKQSIVESPEGGNNAQYKKWATDYHGIGAAKVFPLWNGGNTVKVAITNALYLPAEQALIDEFQNYIDPGAEGLGNGVAPTGAKVTITGGTRKNIDVYANVVLAEGYTEVEGTSEALSDYLASIVFVKNSVSYMRIGSALLDCSSVAEISNLTLNGTTSDVVLTGDDIPVLNSLTLVVV